MVFSHPGATQIISKKSPLNSRGFCWNFAAAKVHNDMADSILQSTSACQVALFMKWRKNTP